MAFTFKCSQTAFLQSSGSENVSPLSEPANCQTHSTFLHAPRRMSSRKRTRNPDHIPSSPKRRKFHTGGVGGFYAAPSADANNNSEAPNGSRFANSEDEGERTNDEFFGGANDDDGVADHRRVSVPIKAVTGEFPDELIKNVFNNFKCPEITVTRYKIYQQPPLPVNPFLWNQLQVANAISTPMRSLKMLYKFGLLFNPNECPGTIKVDGKEVDCDGVYLNSIARNVPYKDGVNEHQYFYCRACRKTYSMFYLSPLQHFNKASTSVQGLFLILWYFVVGVQARDVVKFGANGLMKESTVYKVNRLCRYVQMLANDIWPPMFCQPKLQWAEMDKAKTMSKLSGGESQTELRRREGFRRAKNNLRPQENYVPEHQRIYSNVVVIDESYKGKLRKYQRGYGADKFMILAICAAKGTQMIAKIIPDRSSKTIIPIIDRHVKKGVEIWTDECPTYTQLKDLYEGKHFTVKHKDTLKDKTTGCHTNAAEGSFHWISNMMDNCRGIPGSLPNLQSHMDSFCFRRNFRDRDRCIGKRFLVCLKLLHAEAHQLMRFDIKYG